MLYILITGIVCFLVGLKVGEYVSTSEKKKKKHETEELVYTIKDGINNPTELVMLVEDNAVELFYEIQKKVLEKEGWITDLNDSGSSDGEIHFPITGESVSLENLLRD